MSRSFPLAPMSPFIKVLTILLWLLPLFFGLLAVVSHDWSTGIIFLFLIAIYGAVWLWCRPSHFAVERNYLEIVFPGWQRRIPMQDISNIRIINQETFRQEFGWTIRIGVGGLWGGFGWLWTSRRGFLEFYISQVDRFILIERLTGNNLLITPENRSQFLETINAILIANI